MAENQTYYYDDVLVGLACASCAAGERMGKLDLISVAKEKRGRGIGSTLLNAVEMYWLSNDCKSSRIVTQGDNESACAFYARNNYGIISEQEVWHVWKSTN